MTFERWKAAKARVQWQEECLEPQVFLCDGCQRYLPVGVRTLDGPKEPVVARALVSAEDPYAPTVVALLMCSECLQQVYGEDWRLRLWEHPAAKEEEQ